MLIKELVNSPTRHRCPTPWPWSAASSTPFGTDDQREGMAAFVEKRCLSSVIPEIRLLGGISEIHPIRKQCLDFA